MQGTMDLCANRQVWMVYISNVCSLWAAKLQHGGRIWECKQWQWHLHSTAVIYAVLYVDGRKCDVRRRLSFVACECMCHIRHTLIAFPEWMVEMWRSGMRSARKKNQPKQYMTITVNENNCEYRLEAHCVCVSVSVYERFTCNHPANQFCPHICRYEKTLYMYVCVCCVRVQCHISYNQL